LATEDRQVFFEFIVLNKQDLNTSRALIALGLFLCGKCLIDNISGFLYTFFMSPTIFRIGNYRFYFFSREEDRTHIHVISPDGEAKFWIEPIVALVTYTGFSKRQLRGLQKIVEEHKNEIAKAWQKHFKT